MGAIIEYKRPSYTNFANSFEAYFFAKHKKISLSFYDAIFISRYYSLQLKFVSKRQLSNIDKAIINFLPPKYQTRAYIDTILMDTIFFSHAYDNENLLLKIIQEWYRSITVDKYLDNKCRCSLSDIGKRLSPVFNLILLNRALHFIPNNHTLLFFKHFYTIRQLMDDIIDYELDLGQKVKTYATSMGKVFTRNTIKTLLIEIHKLEIPLYYEKIIKLYEDFYIKFI